MQAQKLTWLLPSAVLLTMQHSMPALAAPPPAPWTTTTVGVTKAPGSVDVDARGLWTIRTLQGDAALSTESFFFVYQPLSGDGSIVALILGQEGGDPNWGRAGVTILQKEAVRSPGAHLQMTTGHGLAFTFRRQDVQAAITEFGDQRYGPRQFPTWLRLQREGNQFTPFTSADGFGWTQLRSPLFLPRFPSDVLAGISAGFGLGGPMTAIFSNPTVAPGQLSPLVQASAGNHTVMLTWPPVPRAVAYLVRRSAPQASGFGADLLTPNPIRETSFVDNARPNDTTFRYLVSPIFEQGGQRLEGWATSILVTPAYTPLNLFGSDIDLEATQLRGAIAFDPSSGTYTISGSGSDIGSPDDHFFYGWQLVKGDFQLTATILDRPSQTGSGARAGVMVRESLEGSARMAFLAGTAANGLGFQYRTQSDQPALPFGVLIADASFKPPFLLRLVRRGSTIAPLLSADGKTFLQAGSPRTFDPPLPESLYLGYAITAQNPDDIATNSFRDLTIEPAPVP
jgi:hypothetical protein